MGRNLSPILRRELANLDKDSASRKSAMKALKSYVKDLDSKAIPMFLAQVSETKETGSISGEYTISLYEVLARVHGVNIVPQIDSIVATIIKTLASSAGSFPLQQACSKVVPAIARYGIDPTTPEDKKRHIIHSLCKPLSEALLGSQDSLTSGAALCLKALVDSDNWRFASDEMVNRVCQNVAVALEEKSTQSNSHMTLVMALAKHNPLIVEAYARLLIQSGLRILDAGVVEGNSQKRLSAIQMVNFLMKSLDSRSIFSELDLIIEEMEKCQSDQMAYVSGAAFEALQTAKKIATEKGSKFEKSPVSVTGSNFGRRDHRVRRNLCVSGDQSPASLSPESQTLDSFQCDSFIGSPVSATNLSYAEYDRGSVNRKHWQYANGGVDISLKDGLFSQLARGSPNGAMSDHSGHHEHTMNGEDTGEFTGFMQRSPQNGVPRSATPSPQRSRSRINVDNINMFTTPRKLIRSLQDPIDVDSDFSEKQSRRCKSPATSKSDYSPGINFNRNGFHHVKDYELRENGFNRNGFHQNKDYEQRENGYLYEEGEQYQGSESVSSTDDIPSSGTDVQVSQEVFAANITDVQRFPTEKGGRRTYCRLLAFIVFAMLAVLPSLIWFDAEDEGHYLVPT
ncbi:Protein sine1 [Turnera subulata]|uniref:Protein sine1 n=1 Tax=Turnera subulata TaxID=218843 RepID=A0A9Q0F6M5_9ROSI|nr:Protein sine1 [Turnera subulata]